MQTDPSKDDPYLDFDGDVFLPHKCDEWLIGGRSQVERMIALLQEILKEDRLKP